MTSKRTMDERERQGLCRQCGKPREDQKYKRCISCREYHARRRMTLYNRRQAANVCPVCGNQRDDPNKKICLACRDWHNAYYREHWSTPQHRHKYRLYSKKYKYGITPDEYRQKEKAQDGKCAICGRPEKAGKSLAVDHNHKTGAIRDLLCRACNSGLGYFQDSLELLEKAAEYLRRHNEH